MKIDPVTLEVLLGGFADIAEEMGLALMRSAYSPNIRERMDCSTALFDYKGEMVGQAEHIPVHLGAMPSAVKVIIKESDAQFNEGDMFILNDPYNGGTHLPDITLVNPIFYNEELMGFSVNRAHHSDIGGSVPGSMGGNTIEIYQEGVRIPPLKLIEKGVTNKSILKLLLSNVRTSWERLGDLRAQIAANRLGEKRVLEIFQRYGKKSVLSIVQEIMNYTERRTRNEISKMPKGNFYGKDFLDDSGLDDKPLQISAKISIKNQQVFIDFTGTTQQVKSPINAVFCVTLSAVYYVFRTITDPTIPLNGGFYRPIHVIAPQGSILNAVFPYPVAGGNVETSQRIVDVLFKALSHAIPEKICSASQGTMNNITIGGNFPKTDRQFTYYETIGGGYGARPYKDGIDGVHSHMTNTMNTPIESLEHSYPLKVERYELIPDSGGAGTYRGGLGIKRDITVLCENAVLSVLGDRQKIPPWGLFRGKDGKQGEYLIFRKNKKIRLHSKGVYYLKRGDTVSIRTPGGGGRGKPTDRNLDKIVDDLKDQKCSVRSLLKDYGLSKHIMKKIRI